VDLDPQANATSGLGQEKVAGGSLYRALVEGGDAKALILPTDYKRFDLLPSEVDLAGAEMNLAGAADAVHRLARLLDPIRREGGYQAIVIDCPPSLGLLTVNALTAADGVLIPLQCEYFALEGLSVMVDVIRRVREAGGNPGLKLDGIVMTMFTSRTRLAQQVVEEVVRHFGPQVYETLVPRNVRLGESPSYGKPVLVYDKRCTGAIAYRRLAMEFIRRNGLSAPSAALGSPPQAGPEESASAGGQNLEAQSPQ
jgi:chromosome partitioning protein